MDPNSLLETHAQLALTLAGFASVVGALARPLTAVQRSRFLILISLALRQVIGCVTPIWLFNFVASPALIWQLASILGFVLFAWHMIWVVVLPTRKLGPAPTILNRAISLLLPLLSVATGLAFLANSLGALIEPNFAVYYFALATSLVSGFLLFADALVGPSSRE